MIRARLPAWWCGPPRGALERLAGDSCCVLVAVPLVTMSLAGGLLVADVGSDYRRWAVGNQSPAASGKLAGSAPPYHPSWYRGKAQRPRARASRLAHAVAGGGR